MLAVRCMLLLLAQLLACCASGDANATAVATCASWCTRDGFTDSHCSHPECAACSGCAGTVACTSTKKDDLWFEVDADPEDLALSCYEAEQGRWLCAYDADLKFGDADDGY